MCGWEARFLGVGLDLRPQASKKGRIASLCRWKRCVRCGFPLRLAHRSPFEPGEGCMCEAMQLRMFGPWNALQQLVAGPTIERI